MIATVRARLHGEAIVKTPDGRYLVVRGRLWRAADPMLTAERRVELVQLLMDARRSLRRTSVTGRHPEARAQVDACQTRPRRAWPGMVDRWRAGLQPQAHQEHAICELIRE